jgi:hypothetical protein
MMGLFYFGFSRILLLSFLASHTCTVENSIQEISNIFFPNESSSAHESLKKELVGKEITGGASDNISFNDFIVGIPVKCYISIF